MGVILNAPRRKARRSSLSNLRVSTALCPAVFEQIPHVVPDALSQTEDTLSAPPCPTPPPPPRQQRQHRPASKTAKSREPKARQSVWHVLKCRQDTKNNRRALGVGRGFLCQVLSSFEAAHGQKGGMGGDPPPGFA